MSAEEIGEAIEILLVEPNPGDVRLFTERLKDAKVMNAVRAVSTGEDALDYVHQRGEYSEVNRPDVIILESRLPGRNLTEALTALKADRETRDIPVVLLASSGAEEEIIESHGTEADTVIQKPVNSEDFVYFVQSFDEFWLAIVQNVPG